MEAARLRERVLGGRIAAALTSTWVLGAVIGLASWGPDREALTPTSGLDSSWRLGINLADAAGLDFGSDVVFTYGPLGFLDLPMLVDGTLAVLSVLYTLALWVGLGVSILYAARRSFPLAVAAPLALAICLITDSPLIPLAVLWSALVLTEAAPAPLRRIFPFAAGLAAAVVILMKLDVGLLVFAVSALAATLSDPSRWVRGALGFGAAFLVSLLTLWLAAGQSLGSLPDFFDTGFQIVSGYTANMGVETVEGAWRYELGAAALIGVALGAAWLGGRGPSRPRQVALLLLAAIAGFYAWKAAFVRHDLARATVVCGVAFALLLAFRWQGRERLVALAALAATCIAYFPLSGRSLGDAIRPFTNLDNAAYAIRGAVDPGERERLLAGSRAGLANFYGLDSGTEELLEGHSVHVYPFETALAWTYGLDWSPLPVFHSYLAYTPDLDRLNAERLLSPEGPERILVHATPLSYGVGSDYFESLDRSQREELESSNGVSIDGRYLPYDQPETTLAMLCNFAPLRTTLAYQVLAPVGDRCGKPRPLGATEAEEGKAVPVPRPPHRDDAVLARVHGLELEGLDRLGAFLYRAPARHVEFDTGDGGRIAPELASSGLVLRTPKRRDFPDPFMVAPQARTVTFSEDAGFLSSAGPLEIEFLAIRLKPLPGRVER